MNKLLLNAGVQEYIRKNYNADILSVSLGKSPFPGISPQELAQQLAGCHKAAGKLPTWHNTPGIYYPPTVNLEQASSEVTARYKAGLAGGETLVDLTGGFGADAYFFSRTFRQVHYCERNAGLAQIAAHNFTQLGAKNIRVHEGDGIASLREITSAGGPVDWIYLDPSRRKADRTRVSRLEDGEPPLPQSLPELWAASRNLLIKSSPLLDLAEGTRTLGPVREVHVVGSGNEVRELLWWLQEGFSGEPLRVAVDLKLWPQPLRFTAAEEAGAEVSCGMPETYLYEPNASILKAGGFKTAAREYGLKKLHPHTHLYTSHDLKAFPGRRFRILDVLPYKPGRLPFKKANVSARNFPEPVARIRKRNRITDGGDTYLFFVRCMDQSLRVLQTEPV